MSHPSIASAPVLCFGEALWDCLPAGLFMGGAPLNVAFHGAQLGLDCRVVSAVGKDLLGDEIARRLLGLGINSEHLARVDADTGTVQVQLDNGKPSYTITEHVAWDAIPVDEHLCQVAQTAGAIVFGSLAQRSAANREQLQRLRTHCSEQCLSIFDVNLRAPYDDAKLIAELARGVDVLKLNDEECALLLGHAVDDLQTGARELCDTYAVDQVIITAGADGAGMLSAGRWYWHDSKPITVVDTIGAGDSFMAAVVHGLLHKRTPDSILERASRLAEFVAGSQGPTPEHKQ